MQVNTDIELVPENMVPDFPTDGLFGELNPRGLHNQLWQIKKTHIGNNCWHE